MNDSTVIQEAREAINRGERERARDLLSRLLRNEKDNPEYWLWMSSVVESTKEQIYCLQNVLRLDPDNINAKRGLILFGSLDAGDISPVPPVRRSWISEIEKNIEQLSGFQKVMANPILRLMVFAGVGIIVTGLILAGVFGTRGVYQPRLTITPIPWTLTPTHTPTHTPEVRTSTPTPVFSPTPQPLWMLLDATYTPMPLYIDTPHPRLEAYRLAMRAFAREDYDQMINFLNQTLREEPEAVDIYYYLGEAYRLSEDYDHAMQYYDKALEINQNFAPAYLSRALVKQSQNPRTDILKDIEKAIETDPVYGEAYLQRAIYLYTRNDYEAALEDLDSALGFIPSDPRLYLERARVLIELGEDAMALTNAEEAHERDITLLPAYLILGRAYLINAMYEEALEAIETYGLYIDDDPMYWSLLGAVLYEIGENYDAALEALDKAKDLDDELAIAHYYHGLTALGLDDPNQAVNDLFIAQSLEPSNFDYNLWFGIALFEDERYLDAYGQINACESLVNTDEDSVLFNYYKAKAGMEAGQINPVREAWLALLNYPEGMVPLDWIAEAETYLAPPTSTATKTETPTFTSTPTNTSTFTQTTTATTTSTSTITPSQTYTLAPTVSKTSPRSTSTATQTPTPMKTP